MGYFAKAIEQRERSIYMQMITAARMAQYDDKGFKAAIKRLGKDG